MGCTYTSAEDSFLLAKHVMRLVYGDVLDMGTGSGIQAVVAAEKPEVNHVLAVDIDKKALDEAYRRIKSAGVLEKTDLLLSNLFEEVEGKFDWILFNPPYLPSEGDIDRLSWTGGCTGGEVIHRFLLDAPGYLKKSGGILLIYSSRTALEPSRYDSYNWTMIDEEDLFFEKLYCALLRLTHLKSNAKASDKASGKG